MMVRKGRAGDDIGAVGTTERALAGGVAMRAGPLQRRHRSYSIRSLARRGSFGSVANINLKRVLGNPSSILCIIAATLSKLVVSPDEAISQPPQKKPRAVIGEADRAQQYVSPTQPGRVRLNEIGFYEGNRGGQGILPLHTHTIAWDICTKTTSARRYGPVYLVEVPEDVPGTWLFANKRKWRENPLLPRVDTKEMWLACIKNTHFVHAQKLVGEGNHRHKNMKSGIPLVLKPEDIEGPMIQNRE